MEVIVASAVNINSSMVDDYASRINKRLRFSTLKSDPERVIRDSDFVVVLDERGEKFNNIDFARRFDKVISSGGYKRVVFILGDSYGVPEDIKKKANLIWSFSDQVFPHKLFAVMLTEQIYRTLEIINNSPYHHM